MEHILIERAAKGDDDAARSLLDLHREALLNFVDLRLDSTLRARLDPEDIVQDALFEVTRRLADFSQRRPMPFRVWVFRTARERLSHAREKHLGRKKRAAQREYSANKTSIVLAELFATNSTPSQRLIRRERSEQLAKFIARLDLDDQELLLMKHVEQLSHKEIGLILDISVDAARKRYARALLRLRDTCANSGMTSDFR